MNDQDLAWRYQRWLRRYFEREATSSTDNNHIPRGMPALRAGDRVSFDLGEGVDGPPYAMNVRRIDGE